MVLLENVMNGSVSLYALSTLAYVSFGANVKNVSMSVVVIKSFCVLVVFLFCLNTVYI